MHEEHPHPLLAQVPLTVSPFLSLPTGTTLPYTYKSLPSAIPPSVIDPPQQPDGGNGNNSPPKPQYVQSTTSNHAAHPDDIIASCQALQSHLQNMEDDARATVRRWEDGIRARELAEKRRVAPGWLDVEERLLVPERTTTGPEKNLMDEDNADAATQPTGPSQSDEGAELDRAFGGFGAGTSQLAFRPK